jgi:hypothetical protein
LRCRHVRQLEKHRQTSADRVDLILAVETHRLFLEFLGIFAILALQLLHMRLQFLHFARRLERLNRQRQNDEARDNREQNDGKPGAARPAIEGQQHLLKEFDECKPDRHSDVSLPHATARNVCILAHF